MRTHRRHGWLKPAAPRVLAVAGAAESWERDLMTGLLCLGDESWVSHEAAAALHGFDRHVAGAVEFTVLRSRRGVEVPFRVHTTATLPAIDRTQVGPFRCVSATRTIIDLARLRISRYRLEAAIDSAVRTGVLVTARAAAAPDGASARRGAGACGSSTGSSSTRAATRCSSGASSSSCARPDCRGRLPQVIFQRDGRSYARVDFHFHPLPVVVEVSGRKGHSSPAERARDAQRRNELQDAGQRVYEYTWEDVTERPSMVARTLTARLNDAGWRR